MFAAVSDASMEEDDGRYPYKESCGRGDHIFMHIMVLFVTGRGTRLLSIVLVPLLF